LAARLIGSPLAPVVVALAGAVVALRLGSTSAPPTAAQAALLVAWALVVMLVFVSVRLANRDWFFPFAFPFFYVGISLMAPVLYLSVLRRRLGILDPSDVSLRLVEVFALTIVGLGIGLAAGMLVKRSSDRPPRTLDYPRLLRWGRIGMALCLPAQAFEVFSRLGRPYGKGFVGFGLSQLIDNFASHVLFAAVILTVIANVHLRKSVLASLDVALLMSFTLSTLIIGSRAQMIAPAIFVMWAQHTFVRRIRLTWLLALTVFLLVVLQGVSGVRGGGEFYTSGESSVERTLDDLSSPVFITGMLLDRFPSTQDFTGGSTYLAAVTRQLPSPVAVALLGPPDDTGSFVFRRSIGFINPDAGLAFSLPSEGYLNFGMAGVLAAGLAVGLIMGFAYREHGFPPVRARLLLYPVMVASLPLGLRSDALGQIKGVLYPLLILAWVLHHLSDRVASTSVTPGEGLEAHTTR